MELNKEIVKSWLSTKETLENRISRIASKFVENNLIKGLNPNFYNHVSKWEIRNREVEIELYESWGYGGQDYHQLVFPLKYLFQENYEEEILKLKRRKIREEKKLKNKLLQEKATREKEHYLELKKKFSAE